MYGFILTAFAVNVMDLARLIGKILRPDRHADGRAAALPSGAGHMHQRTDGAAYVDLSAQARVVEDEQAGDSYLGYID